MAGGGRDLFVGRASELADLRGLIGDARAGEGRLVLVSGPAGIGKTRLVEEAVADADCPVLWGRCVDDPGVPPLWPWHRVLARIPAARTAAAAARGEIDLLPGDVADPGAARFRFEAGTADALMAAAEPDGLVVVIDDLHWADTASVRLLRHLAPEVRRSRLLVVATHRSVTGPILDGELPELLRWAHMVALPPLDEDDVAAYLASAGPGRSPRAVYLRSGGNPLYLRAVAHLPAEPPSGDPLRYVVRTALSGLDPVALDLISIAAVLGEDVDSGLLAEVAGCDGAEVLRGLEPAVRDGLLVAPPTAPTRLRFAHAVVRDGVYADLDPAARAQLHQRSATALETRAALEPTLAGTIAGHLLRSADDAGTLRRAATWASRAGAAATRSLAFDEAARFLSTAVEALQDCGAGPEDRAAVLVELAAAEYRAGRFGPSVRRATAASEAAAAAGRPDLMAAAALVVQDVAAPDLMPALAELCERALGVGAELPAATRARLLAHSASLAADSGRSQEAEERSAAALRLAEECAQEPALVDAVRARMKVRPFDLDVAERLRLGRLAVALAAPTGQPLSALWGHKWRIEAALEAGTMNVVEAELAELAALATSTRLPLIRWHEQRIRASVLCLYGDFAAARELNEAARRELADDASAAGMSDAFLLQLALLTGEREFPDQLLDSLAVAPDIAIVRVSRVLVALLSGQRDKAAALYEAVRPLAQDLHEVSYVSGVAQNFVPLVEEFADRDIAATLVERFTARGPVAAEGAGVLCVGSSAGDIGRLELVLGRYDRAFSALTDALAVNTRIGARPSVVRNRIDLARALLREGGVGTARRAEGLARQAATEARRLGMPGQLARAEAVAEKARTAAKSADPLTTREREITELLAAAMSNRDIADRLVLSERTVESHVRNILAKLGLTNRTEVAAWAIRSGEES